MTIRIITTSSSHGIEAGQLVTVDGRAHKVVAVTGSALAVEPQGWITRTWCWLTGLVRIRGFWARVWRR